MLPRMTADGGRRKLGALEVWLSLLYLLKSNFDSFLKLRTKMVWNDNFLANLTSKISLKNIRNLDKNFLLLE